MIISHKYKYIFLKTRKTAGTSLDIALARECSEWDIITERNPEDEALSSLIGSPPAQNFLIPWRLWTSRDIVKRVFRRKIPQYTEHMIATSLRARLEPGIWNGYFKFCVERNPFDKAISLYYWRTRNLRQKPSLISFLRNIDARSLSNFHIYSLEQNIAVDFVIRYESLEDGLSTVVKHLSLPSLELPEAKRGYRADTRHYREVLTCTEKRIIQSVCRREIELLQYEY